VQEAIYLSAMKFSSLPRPLLFLLFTCPVLAAPSTTRNDPFRTIALKQPKLEKDPICCLIPLSPAEPQPTEDELLLSFEDWKAKLLAEEKSNSATGSSGDPDHARHTSRTDPIQAVDGSGDGGNEGGGAEGTDPSSAPRSGNPVPSTSGQTLPQEQLDFGFGEPVLPHFRVPLTDRFNYASMECSARIHKAHKSAKSASSILSSKKDRYMLSPCAAKTADGKEENHFVVVELCEDIRIDTVQLANFEFFSGVFKDFTVSVAKTYTPDVPEWTTVGTYMGRNVRGVQVCDLHLRELVSRLLITLTSHSTLQPLYAISIGTSGSTSTPTTGASSTARCRCYASTVSPTWRSGNGTAEQTVTNSSKSLPTPSPKKPPLNLSHRLP